MKTLLVYVIGPTNAGKSTLLNAAGTIPEIGLCEIGKYMRAKYPPSHFKGQNNPAHTAAEAWQVYETQVKEAEDAGKKAVFIDGQPRDVKQCLAVLDDKARAMRRIFVHLWAPLEVLTARAEKRDGSDPEKLALTRARLVNDMPPNYDILCRLISAGEDVHFFDTSKEEFEVLEIINKALFIADRL